MYLYKILFSFLILILLTSCGGGGGSSDSPVSENTELTAFEMNVVNNFIEDSTTAGDIVVTVKTIPTDEDGGTITYSILRNDNGYYSIAINTGTVTLTSTGASFVNSGNDLPSFDVKASSSNSSKTITNLDPTIYTINDSMTLFEMNVVNNFIQNSTTSGDIVTTIKTIPTDEDGGTITYSLLKNDDAYYAIDTNTATVTLTSIGASHVNTGNELPPFDVRADSSNSSKTISNLDPSVTITVVNTTTGYFYDSAVSGLNYTCSNSSFSGVTELDGSYVYDENCGDITFSIGNITVFSGAITSLPSDGSLYIADLIGADRSDTTNSEVVKIAQFLQSLDDDGNPANGININDSIKEELSSATAVTLTSPSTTLSDLNDTIASLNTAYYSEIIPAEDAVIHYTKTLYYNDELDNNPYPPAKPTLASGTIYYTSTDVKNITLIGDAGTRIYVNNVFSGYFMGDNGQYTFNLDTSGADGIFSFSIFLQDYSGTEDKNSTALDFNITKDTTAPAFTSTNTFSIDENSANSFDINASDTNTLIYSIDSSSTDYDDFIINSSNGVLEFKEIPNYENPTDYNKDNIYKLKINVSDGVNTTLQDITISVNNLNDAAPLKSPFTYSFSANEGVASGSTIGSLAISTTGDSTASSIELQEINGSLSDTFNISLAGTITTKPTASIDYESLTTRNYKYDLRAIATNEAGDSNEANITITINDLKNEIIPILEPFATAIDENTTAGTIIGTVEVNTTGDSNISSFTLTGSNAGLFSINSSGVISLASGATLDYETTTIYNLSVYATNSAGNSESKNVVITINNIPEIVPTLQAFSGSIIENANSNSIIGTLSLNKGDSNITNIDLNETNGSAQSIFAIDNDGVITLVNSGTIDYESKSTYSLKAIATNTAGNSNSVTVTINITNASDTVPTVNNLSFDINENITDTINPLANLVINSGDSSISSILIKNRSDNSISSEFKVSTLGAITLKSGASIDYESSSSYIVNHAYNLYVVASNDAGDSNEANITVSINDLQNEVKPIIESFTTSIDENTTVGTNIGSITITNSGLLDSNITSFTLTGDGAGNFNIDTNGSVTLESGASFDYESKSIYNLTLYATNEAGNSNSVSFTININNIPEIKPTLQAFSGSVNEDESNNTTIGTMTFNSGDSNISSFTLYEADGVTLSNEFNISTDGIIKIKDNTNINYETKSSYSLRAKAINLAGVSNIVTVTININNVSDSVASINNATFELNENVVAGTQIGSLVVSSGDSTITSIVLKNRSDNSISEQFISNTAGTITVKSGASIDYETDSSYSLYAVASSEAGSSNEANITITILNLLNETKATLNPLSVSVDENISSGSVIGTVSVSDSGDSNITSFTLTGTNAGLFDINSTGTITLASNVTLDYESIKSYSLSVYATNLAGDSASKVVSITVLNVNDTPPILLPFTKTINEGLAGGSEIGTIGVSSSGDSTITSYELNDTTTFEISNSGLISLKSTAIVDYETTQSYTLQARASNTDGWSEYVNVTITVNNLANEVVPVIQAATFSIDENSIATTFVGNITITNKDDLDSNISSFTITGVGAGDFTIENNGTVRVNSGADLDYESQKKYTLTITATNNAGTSNAVTLTINLNNVAESVPSLTPFSGNLSVSEDASNGLVIGTIVYSSDTNITAFEIYNSDGVTPSSEFNVSLDGIIAVENNTTLNYSTTPTYNLKAKATNSFGDSSLLAITVSVTNVANVVPSIDNATFTINENIPSGTSVGNLVVIAGDAPVSSIVLKNRSNDSISNEFISSTTGAISVKSGATINYEDNSSYSLYAIATNSVGSSNEANITIDINNLTNEITPILAPNTVSVDENASDGTTLGTITVTNSGSLDSNITKFNISGTGSGDFTIDTNGTIKVNSGASINYETIASYSLSITATNQAGTSDPVTLTINVNNIAEIKPTLQAFNASINENPANGTILGTISFSKGDSDIISFDLNESNGSAQSAFTISNTGVVSVNDNSTIDYEALESRNYKYDLIATATNNAGTSTPPVTVTISINNVADVSPTLLPFTKTINEGLAGGSEIGTIGVSSSGDSTITSYELNDTTTFEISNSGLISLKSTAIVDYETTQSYTLQARASNTDGWSEYVNVTITVNNLANEVVPVIQAETFSIDENSIATTFVGNITITNKDDLDSNISSFTITGVGAGDFTIENNGTVRVNSGADLDYESQKKYTLTITATNNAGTSNAVTLTINLNNVAESVPSLTPFSGNLSVSEDASNGLVIGTIVYSSDTNITAFEIYNSDGVTPSSEFNVSLDGIIAVENNTTLNYSTTPTYNLKAKATNSFGDSSLLAITVSVTNVANVVPSIDNATFTINENIPSGTSVGNLVVIAGDAPVSSIVLKNRSNDSISNEFISSTTGAISVKSGATINYEDNSSYSLYAIATNSVGSSNEANITIDINNLTNEITPILAPNTVSVDENASDGTTLGTITVTNSGSLDSNITKFNISGTGSGDFTIDTNGTIKVNSGASINYETIASYSLSITATNQAGTSDPVTLTINVNNIAEIKPTLQAFNASINENPANGTILGTISFSKGDSDIISFDLNESNGSAQSAFTISNTGVVSVNDNSTIDYEALESRNYKYDLIATATNNAGTSTPPVTVTISINNVADVSPTLLPFTKTINEGLAGGSEIGTIGVSSSGDSTITSYELNDTTTFEISNSGLISLKSTAIVDYETTQSYTLQARASNTDGWSEYVNVTITVNNLANEVVPVIQAETFSIDENSIATTFVGNITITNKDDLDSNISSFTITGVGAGDFTIENNGTVRVNSGADLDYESQKKYTLTITATNDAGTSNAVTLTINLNNVAESKPILQSFNGSIAENANNNDIVGSLLFTTTGDSNITNIDINESNGSLSTVFSVNTAGEISVLDKTQLDYETKSSYTLSASATNSAGVSTPVTVIINLINVGDAVAILNPFSGSIDENVIAGSIVGNLVIDSIGDSPITRIDLNNSVSELNTQFAISTNGIISVKSGVTLDYETTPSYALKATAYNSVGSSASVDVNISINNLLNETKATLNPLSVSVDENISSGSVIGTVSVSDSGDSNITSFTLTGTNAGLFDINSTGTITLASNVTLDYESIKSYSLSVYATNLAGDSASKVVSITVLNVNDTPPILLPFTKTINEGLAGGSEIGTISISSVGDSPISSYELDDSSTFEISNSGVLSVKSIATINYEDIQSYHLQARASNTDGWGPYVNVNITVNDLKNEIIPILEPFATAIDENTTAGTIIGTVEVNTTGDSNISSFTLTGSNAGLFSINSSGVISLASGATLDYETTTIYNLSVYATNSAGNSESKNVVITINNIPEIVPTLQAFSGSIIENANSNSIIGTLSLNKGDSNITNIDLNETNGSAQSIFAIDNDGVITLVNSGTIDYESKSTYSLKAIATNTAGNSNSVTVTINITNASDTVPTVNNLSFDINENITDTINPLANLVINSGDSSISSILIKNRSDNSISSEFKVSTLGAITLKSGASIDYESSSSYISNHAYNLYVVASNDAGDSNEANITVSINDLQNEVKPIIESFTTSIDENTTVGTNIGSITITNSGLLDSNITSFTLTGDGAGNFNIDTNGSVTLESGASFDYESKSIYNLTLYATNEAGNSNSVSFTININNIPEIKPTLQAFSGSVNEDESNNTTIGTMTFNSGDSNISSFTLYEADGVTLSNEFNISTDGIIKIKDNTNINYETKSSYSLRAKAINLAGVSNIVTVTININNVSDAVPVLENFSTTINENIAGGSTIGSIVISDAGDTSISSIRIEEINGTLSDIFEVSSTGIIRTKPTASIDYESLTTRNYKYDLRAIATNSAGDSNEANITITINDLKNEIIPILEPFATAIDENTTAGTIIGTVEVNTTGDSNISSFTLTGSNAGLFSINSSGVISLASGATLDYETTTIYNLSVYATNSAGNSESKNVVITINNIPEIVPTLQAFSGSIIENANSNSIIGTLSLNKGDSNITNIDLNETNGSAQSIFAIDNDGVITLVNSGTIDYESKSTYSLKAIATNTAGNSNSVTVTINITNASDTVPTLLDFNTSIDENSVGGTSVGYIVISDSGDSSIIAMSLVDADTNITSNKFDILLTGEIKVKSGVSLNYEVKNLYELKATATNASGASNRANITIHLNNLVNEIKPTLSASTISIDENASANTLIGNMIISNLAQLDSDISHFTVTGYGAGNFNIDSNGSVTLASGVALDYETSPSYSLSITATNQAGTSDPVTLTINVNNIAEIKPTLQAFNASINENPANGTILGTISFSKGDSDIISFDLNESNGSAQSAFTISNTGVVSVNDNSTIDYEALESRNYKYDLIATATNNAGTSTPPVTVTISINNVADVSPTLLPFTKTINEGLAGGSEIGTIGVSSSGDSTITSYELNDTTTFEISNSGLISLKSTAIVDYETTQSYTLQARASNTDGWSEYVNVTITVNNLANEVVPVIQAETFSIDENSIATTFVGNITITNKDDLDSNISSFTITGVGAGDFTIENNGTVRVNSGADLDYESQKKYTLTITATNDAGTSNAVTLTINLNNVAESKPILQSFNGSIAENANNNDIVGSLLFTTTGDSNITNIDINESNGSLSTVFSVNTAGEISVLDKTQLDYETKSSYTLSASATNSAGVSTPVTVIINLINVGDAVAILNPFSGSIDENVIAGSIVGNLVIDSIGDSPITRIDLNNSVSELNTQFAISTNGIISVKSGVTLDYETTPSYALKATAYNSVGSSASVDVNISINNLLNETKATLNPLSVSVDENISSGSVIGTVSVSDSGDSNITSFTLTGTNAGLFDINSTGTITLASNVTLDYESIKSYSLSVYATNLAGDSASKVVSITVLNVNELAPTLNGFNGSVSESESNGTVIGSISFTSGDSDITHFDLNETDGSAQSVFVISNSGAISVNNASLLDADTRPSYTLTAVAYNSFGASNSASVVISVDNVADRVPNIANFATTINENISGGTEIGSITISDSGDSQITAITLSDTSVFEITLAGAIKTKVDAVIDFETTQEYNLTVTATNTAGTSAEANVTITVNNLANEVVPVIQAATFSIDENSIATTFVGNITITNKDDLDSNISSFTITGVGAGDFTIENNGTVRVNSGADLDYESQKKYTLTITATNNAGTSNAVTLTINLNNVAESVPSLTPFSGNLSVSEDASNGLVIGTIVYSSDTNITAFEIYNSDGVTPSSEFNVSLDGIIAVENNTTLNYSTTPTYNLKAKATNSFGDSSLLAITVSVTNVANVVPSIDNATFTINENIPSGTSVGNLVVIAGDAPVSSIVLKNRSNDSISNEFISSTTGAISVKSGATINYEDNSSYSLYAIATNSVGSSNEANITIDINNLTNEITPILAPNTVSVDENASDGTTLGTITVTNSGSLDSNITKFNISGTGSGDFTIDTNGTIKVNSGASINYETIASYSLSITATNQAGTSDPVTLTINVNNIAESVPTLQAFSGSVNEDASNNTTIGTLLFNKGDSNITSFTLYESDGSTISNEFNISLDGLISVKDNTNINYEATSSYSLRAKATNSAGDSNIVTVTITINNVSDTVASIDNLSFTINENITDTTNTLSNLVIDSGDSAITSIVIKNRLDNSISTEFKSALNGSISLVPNATIDYESTSSYISNHAYSLYAIATNSAGDSNEANITITINDLKNEIIPILEPFATAIDENTTAGTIIGTVEVNTTGDSNISSFTLTGSNAGLFSINSSGVISLASGATLDYETTTIYNLSVYATNSAGNSESKNVVITINNIPEIVPTLQAFSGSVNEDASNNTTIGTLLFNKGDSNITSFTLYESDGSTISNEFNISLDGLISVKDNTNINYEATSSYSLRAKATNSAGDSNIVTVTITINNVSDTVASIDNLSFTINENITDTTNTLSNLVIDSGDSAITSIVIKNRLDNSISTEFKSALNGSISLVPNATIDYESTSSYISNHAYSLYAIATNSAGDSNEANITITINDLKNEIIPILEPFATAIDENTTAGTIIGTVEVNTTGDSNISSFTLTGSNAGLFSINSSGVISLASGATLDYETTTIYNLSVYATNSAGNSESKNVVITINNIPEIVPTLQAFSGSIIENANSNSIIGTLSLNKGDSNITNIDLNETNGSAQSIFAIDNDGVITLVNSGTIDYESKSTYSLKAIATNTAGNSNSVTVTINITNASDTVPTVNNLSFDINENITDTINPLANLVINSGDSSISSILIKNRSDNSISSEFKVSTLGAITLKSGASIDYESSSSYISNHAYNLYVVASNDAGDSNEANITVSINDLQNEVKPIIESFTTSIDENTTVGTNIGSITITNSGLLDSNITSFTLTGDGAGNFNIDTNGSVTLESGASFDYESKSIYNLTLYATNEAGNSNSVSFTININNIPEIKPTLQAFSGSVNEDESNNTTIGTMTFNSGDSNISSFTLYEADGVTLSNEFNISTDGIIKIKDNTNINYETKSSYSLRAKAINLAGVSNIVTVTININNVSDAVPVLENFSTTINENIAGGSTIGSIVISDAGDTSISSIRIEEINGTLSDIFEVSSTGIIRTKPTASIDYESLTTRNYKYDLRAIATNSAGDSNEANITITINDLKNEIIPILEPFATAIDENTTAGTIIGTVEVNTTGDSNISSFTLTGSNAGLFSINSSGVISLASGATLDYETTTIYNLSVYATNSAGNSESKNVVITINNIPEIVPTLQAFSGSIIENANSNSIIGTLSLNKGDSSITNIDLNETNGSAQSIFAIDNDGVITLVNSGTIDYESKSTYSLKAIATNTAGNSNSVTVTINITNASDTVPTVNNLSFDINENITDTINPLANLVINSGDSSISSILIKNRSDNSISSEFKVSTLGAITLKSGASIDYESSSSYIVNHAYNLYVVASNDAGDSNEANITVSINDLQNEVKPIIESFTTSIDENTTVGTNIGSITITNSGLLDSNITSFTLTGDGAGNFNIDTNGSVTLASGALIDYESKTSYALTMIASNDAGDSVAKAFSVTINNISESVPFITSFSKADINEDAAIGLTVGTISFTSDGAITDFKLIYENNTSLSNEFNISLDGIVKVKDNSNFDYETKSTYTLRAIGTNNKGDSNPYTITINLKDIADTPPVLDNLTVQINENETDATKILGNIVITPGDGIISAITLKENSITSTKFKSTPNGAITLISGATIDYETQNEYNLTAVATSSAGDSNEANITVQVIDIAEIKPILAATSIDVNESTPAGTKIGDLNITNFDDLDAPIHTYIVDGTSAAYFRIDENGSIFINDGAYLDYEDPNELDHRFVFSVKAINSVGTSNIVSLIINILDVYEQPPILKDTTFNIDENATAGTVLGQIDLNTTGDAPIVSYDINSDPLSLPYFEVNATGYITLINRSNLDFETQAQYNFVATATSSAGISAPVSITININDIPEIPPTLANSILSLEENATGGTYVADVNITDMGDSNFTSCTLGGTDVASFDINTSGSIFVASGVTFDYLNGQTQYALTVSCENIGGVSNSVDIVINIIDTPSELAVLHDLTISVKETQPRSTQIGQITIDSGDTAISSITITSPENTHDNNFEISTDGTITLASDANISYDYRSSYQFYVKATNSLGDSDPVLVTINIIEVENLYIQTAIYDNNGTTSVDDDILYLYFNRSIDETTLNNNIEDDFVLSGSGALGTGVSYTYIDTPFHLLKIEPATSGYSLPLKPNDTQIRVAFEEITDSDQTYIKDYIYTPIESVESIIETGQTNSYDGNGSLDGSIKDDGYYNAGSSRDFVRDNTNEVVYDNVQNLIWDDSTNATNHTEKWDLAKTYCSNPANFNDGSSHWRLPTVNEITSIIDRSKYAPALDNTIFTNLITTNYWASEESNIDTTKAWSVNFNTGQSSPFIIKTDTLFVRCVREQN